MEVVNFTHRPLYPRGKRRRYPLDRRTEGLKADRNAVVKGKILCLWRESNPVRPARSLVTIVTGWFKQLKQGIPEATQGRDGLNYFDGPGYTHSARWIGKNAKEIRLWPILRRPKFFFEEIDETHETQNSRSPGRDSNPESAEYEAGADHSTRRSVAEVSISVQNETGRESRIVQPVLNGEHSPQNVLTVLPTTCN
jgi:hypothetical protein